MSIGMPWTDKEINRLKLLYESVSLFDEVTKAFPHRTSNAIRLKASRLGLRRPIVTSLLCESQTVLLCSNIKKNKDEYLFKCGGCGKWILVDLDNNAIDKTIVCPECSDVCIFIE
jgi:hypothetical protein